MTQNLTLHSFLFYLLGCSGTKGFLFSVGYVTIDGSKESLAVSLEVKCSGESTTVSYCSFMDVSYIRKGKCRPATPTTPTAVSRSGDPPRILKWAGLESSGRRLNS